jgi:hypothetical protein
MTMTDSDEPAPPRSPLSTNRLGKEEPRGPATAAGDGPTIRRPTAPIAHIAPTDPEVPSAKRRGVLRRQRSLVGLAAVIMGLFSMTLVLLYRASLRVGARATEDGLPRVDDHRPRHPASFADVNRSDAIVQQLTAPNAMRPSADRGDDAADMNENSPAGSASSLPKGPPPALDIIRTPAF